MRIRPKTEALHAEDIRAHIDRNLTDSDMSIARLAAEMAMSRSSLYRVWNAHFRVSIHAYILRRRLDLAHEMLQTGRYRVTDVALVCGFSSQPYFTKAFKKAFGCPPSELPMGIPGQ